jgi:uncharacterized protein YdeI (YjbR/CyaY-like superfamily)
MRTRKNLYVINRDEWRAWLKENHKSKKEIWLVYYKKHTGKQRIPYDDAVEEAICFGWIDSTIRKLDEEKYAQKYTPRRSGSVWSLLNIKRAHKMIKEERMTQAGLALFKEAGKKKSSKARIPGKKLSVPADLKKALSKNKKAMNNFDNFAPSYKKMYILWIDDAKKQETRRKRIKRVVEWAVKNQKPGMM